MARALELAELGTCTTQPNPPVGCVIARDERILAEGWHERAGGPHAEIVALRALAAAEGEAAAVGTTVYVTLEPCSHHGRTPPCVDALIAAHVGRVVFAIEDPNPKVAGEGVAALERAGIEVASGLMAEQAEEVNAGFLMRMRSGRPFVRVKVAMSLDGRTALASGASKWITGEAAREDVQHWRARSSAVLTGIGTILADDPQLDVRLPGTTRHPARVVLDRALRTPLGARVLSGAGETVIFTANPDAARLGAFQSRGVSVERVAARSQPGAAASAGVALSLPEVLSRLGALQMNEVLVEAGPTLTGAFVQHGLADELLIYIAPKLLGPQARPLFDLPLLENLQQALRFAIIDERRVGSDLRLRLRKA